MAGGGDSIQDRRKQILDLLKEKGEMTIKQFRCEIMLTEEAIRNYLKELVEKGLVIKEKKYGVTIYKIGVVDASQNEAKG